MSLCYDFEKWTMISLSSVAITLTIGLINLSYGQLDPNNYLNTRDENQHNDNNGIGELLKHKGDLYCYDSNTTATKEVKNWVSKKDYKESDYPKKFNDYLTDTLKSNGNMSQIKEMCDNMVDLYIISNEDYHQRESLIPDNDIELELEFEWEIIK
jgi:hypothetical protein